MIVVHDLCHMANSHKKYEKAGQSERVSRMTSFQTEIFAKINLFSKKFNARTWCNFKIAPIQGLIVH